MTRTPAGLALLTFCLTFPASAQIEERLSAEIRRLEATLAKVDTARLPKELQDLVKSQGESLAAVARVESPMLRLYRLREPFVLIETLRVLSDHSAASESGAAFETLWKSRAERFDEKRAAPKGPLIQTALVQAARNRAEKLYRASLPYSRVARPWSGTYYLGEAEGNLAYGAFVESLDIPIPLSEPRPTAQRLRQEIDRLEAGTIALFERDPAGREAIPVSARLKEARELLDQGQIEGTTLTMLETHLGLQRRLLKDPPSEEGGTSLGPYDSLAGLYAAMADEDSQGDTRRLVRTSVLPFYFSLVRSSR